MGRLRLLPRVEGDSTGGWGWEQALLGAQPSAAAGRRLSQGRSICQPFNHPFTSLALMMCRAQHRRSQRSAAAPHPLTPNRCPAAQLVIEFALTGRALQAPCPAACRRARQSPAAGCKGERFVGSAAGLPVAEPKPTQSRRGGSGGPWEHKQPSCRAHRSTTSCKRSKHADQMQMQLPSQPAEPTGRPITLPSPADPHSQAEQRFRRPARRHISLQLGSVVPFLRLPLLLLLLLHAGRPLQGRRTWRLPPQPRVGGCAGRPLLLCRCWRWRRGRCCNPLLSCGIPDRAH